MSLSILLLLLISAWGLRQCQWRKCSRTLFGLALVFFIAVGNGFLPKIAIAYLQQDYRLEPTIQWSQPTRIVLLAGGAERIPGTTRIVPSINTFSRITMAAKLYRQCVAADGQCTIDGSGQEPKRGKIDELSYRAELVALGIPDKAIQLTSGSFNTYQEARYIATLPKEQLVLVSSGFHLRRAVADFAQVGLTVVPVAADYLKVNITPLPTAYHFEVMDIALHEYLGYLGISWLENPIYQAVARFI